MTQSSWRAFDWPLVPLQELARDVQSGFACGERDPNGIVQMRMNNVATDGGLDWTNVLRVPAIQDQVAKYQLSIGDVLFNSTNSPELVGKTALFTGYAEPVVFSNHFVRIRVDETRLDPRYLARWLTHQWRQQVFEGLCTQWVNQAAVRKEDLLSLQVPLPPLTEQKRIAAILDKADRLRRLRRYALELGDTYLQSVFLEMFGDPDKNPRGWEVKPMGTQIKDIRYGTGSPPKYQDDGVPFIRATNIKNGTVERDGLVFISEVDARKIAKCQLKAGDLILVRSGVNTGDCAVIPAEYDGAYAAYDLIIEMPYPSNVYYNFLVNSDYGKFLIQPLTRRAAQPHINAEQIKSLELPFPPISLQEKFVQVVHKFDRLRAQQREAERQAEHLFQSLLHRAFAGEL